ncbi:hypothetical protein J3R73_001606 [Labrys monachus]|uniref:Uncharacterized protein n=1 Tax=Labrys monachus TaxID=217067 RepID=A0ABU0FCF4_9HYPH|nr:hypothetical protein [Labrys monachus]
MPAPVHLRLMPRDEDGMRPALTAPVAAMPAAFMPG